MFSKALLTAGLILAEAVTSTATATDIGTDSQTFKKGISLSSQDLFKMANKPESVTGKAVFILIHDKCWGCEEFSAAVDALDLDPTHNYHIVKLDAKTINENIPILRQLDVHWHLPHTDKNGAPHVFAIDHGVIVNSNYFTPTVDFNEVAEKLKYFFSEDHLRKIENIEQIGECANKANFVFERNMDTVTKELWEHYDYLAKKYRGSACFHFYLTANATALWTRHYAGPTIKPDLVNDGGSIQELDFAHVEKFIVDNLVPPFGTWSAQNRMLYSNVFAQGKPLVVFAGTMDHYNTFKDKITGIALEAKDVTFLHWEADEKEEGTQNLWEGHPLPVGIVWVEVAEEDSEEKYREKFFYSFKPTDATSADGLMEYVRKAESGKIVKPLKSQPASEASLSDTELNIYTTDIMMEKLINNKTGLSGCIRVHAPWCGHCRKMHEDWKAAARKLMAEYPGKLVIADIDGTENNIPKNIMKVTGFPSGFCWSDADKTVRHLPGLGGRKEAELYKMVKETVFPQDELVL
jgi:thiol-disulfide isomerase/thioredoxin